MVTALVLVGAWCGIAVALAAGWARIPRRRPVPPPAPIRTQAYYDAVFASLVPGFVTAETFALDAELNRKAGWAL